MEVKPTKSEVTEMSKARMLKNCSVIGVSVMLYLCGNNTCRELQSSINIEGGLGTYTQTANSAATIVSMIFLPPFLIKLLTLKGAMVFSLFFTIPYYLANFYPTWGTMIAGAIISGILATSIWAAKGTYLTAMAERYSSAFGTPLDSTISLFFGIFYAFYYFGYIWGNTLSYLILTPPHLAPLSADELHKCGLYFCDDDASANQNFLPPPPIERYILFGAFIAASLLAALLVLAFLDPMKQSSSENRHLTLIIDTLRAVIRPRQILVAPMGVFRGILRTFLATEFTKAYITCSMGIRYVGLSMIGFGVVCGISSFVFGKIVRFTGRFAIFTLALILHIAVFVVLVLVKPGSSGAVSWFYAIPCVLGICNAAWESQVAGIYGVIFSEDREVSFNLYALTEEVGGMIAYGYSASLCLQYKFGILAVMTAIAYCSFLIAEFYIIKKHSKGSMAISPQ